MARKTPEFIKSHKNNDTPLVCLTAYSYPMATFLDPICDLILVGDSLGTAFYGMQDTVDVTLDMMICHGRAVMRGANSACIVVDMPHGTYEDTPEQALENAARIIRETGCDAVKLEGGQAMAQTISHLTSNGVAVMAHIGLLPQSARKEGGYKIKGKTDNESLALIEDARAVEQAGAFSVVIEGTIHTVADEITQAITIPTIGIGASAACDGQILVTEDMLGFTAGHVPKFVKQYADLATVIKEASEAYADAVRKRTFPEDQNLYKKKVP